MSHVKQMRSCQPGIMRRAGSSQPMIPSAGHSNEKTHHPCQYHALALCLCHCQCRRIRTLSLMSLYSEAGWAAVHQLLKIHPGSTGRTIHSSRDVIVAYGWQCRYCELPVAANNNNINNNNSSSSRTCMVPRRTTTTLTALPCSRCQSNDT